MQAHSLDILERAEEAGDLRTALAAISQARGNLELLLRLLGELNEQPAFNITLLEHPGWRELQAVIFDALRPYPEARMAMIRAVAGVQGRGDGRALN